MAIVLNASETYKKQGVMTASPLELIVMLYDGFLRQVRAADAAIAEKDMEAANTALLKAQDIVTELMSSLDFRMPISRQLMQIYDFVHWKLREANANKDNAGLEDVAAMMGELRESWAQIKMSPGTHCVLEG
jgi:flagellar protein FliS